MSFKIGDKVFIQAGTWSVLIDKEGYHKNASLHQVEKSGVVIAVNCRLPFGRWAKNASPVEGLMFSAGCVYNDLLVSIEEGLVFTSTRHVKLVSMKPKKYYAYIFGSIKMEITKKQYDEIEEAEKTIAGHLIPGLLEVK